MNGWHFTNGMTLRDGQPLVAGKTYRVDGPLKLCERGLHASERAIDALRYAPGAMVSRVRLGGTIERGDDKACATERTVLWCADATRVLQDFALAVATNAVEELRARGIAVTPETDAALEAARRRLAGEISANAAGASANAAGASANAAWASAYAAGASANAARASANAAGLDAQNALLETMLLSLEP